MSCEDFETVAALLVRLNPAVARQGYTQDMLVAHMQSFAFTLEREGHVTGSTFGYRLTLFRSRTLPTLPDRDGEMICWASLTPNVVESHVTHLQDALGTAETGDALIEVASNAHRAEMQLAEIDRLLGKVYRVDCE